MGRLDYEELGWQEAIVLGCAKQEGILEALADKERSAVEVANQLGLSLRAVDTLLSALVELGVLAEEGNRFRLLEEHRRPLLDPRLRWRLSSAPVQADPEVEPDARDTEDRLPDRG